MHVAGFAKLFVFTLDFELVVIELVLRTVNVVDVQDVVVEAGKVLVIIVNELSLFEGIKVALAQVSVGITQKVFDSECAAPDIIGISFSHFTLVLVIELTQSVAGVEFEKLTAVDGDSMFLLSWTLTTQRMRHSKA